MLRWMYTYDVYIIHSYC